eukprot:TRINITY_DN5519_c0_g1_i1.p1 TRINITY_DN5519_c0_g1~~TRINITY_DN5519_c0_g1_i1.p1  ORF type:complete len:2175 (+),score=490.22 TRINITY_DN5519_c0_g1_i1:67-6525(+)
MPVLARVRIEGPRRPSDCTLTETPTAEKWTQDEYSDAGSEDSEFSEISALGIVGQEGAINVARLFDDSYTTYGNCHNRFHGLRDLVWYHRIHHFGETLRGGYNSTQSPLCLLDATGPLRKRLVHIVDSAAFDRAVLVFIITNAVCLAMDIPSLDGVSALRRFLDIMEIVFLIVFTAEALLKVGAMGFCAHAESYLLTSEDRERGDRPDRAQPLQPVGARDVAVPVHVNGWNLVDFLIVILAWIGLHPAVANVSVARSLRLLRPLRALRHVRGLQVVLRSLASCIGPLTDVAALLIFFIITMAISGNFVWAGSWHQRCYVDVAKAVTHGTTLELQGALAAGAVSWNASGPAPVGQAPPRALDGWVLSEWAQRNDTRACTESGPGRFCHPASHCRIGDERRWSYLHFDNLGTAMLMVLKAVALDDWPDDLAIAMDVSGPGAVVFFFVVTLMGSYFIMNLVLAVLCGEFAKHRLLMLESAQLKRRHALRGQHMKYPVLPSTMCYTFVRLVMAPYAAAQPNRDTRARDRAALAFLGAWLGGSRRGSAVPSTRRKTLGHGTGEISRDSVVAALAAASDGDSVPSLGSDPGTPLANGVPLPNGTGACEDTLPYGTALEAKGCPLLEPPSAPPERAVLRRLKRPRPVLRVAAGEADATPRESPRSKGQAGVSPGASPCPSPGRPCGGSPGSPPPASPRSALRSPQSRRTGSRWQAVRLQLATGGLGRVPLPELQAVGVLAVAGAAAAERALPDPPPQPSFAGSREAVLRLINSSPFNYFIIATITINIVAMCVDHHGIDPDMTYVLDVISLICNICFVVEMLLKMWGLGLCRRTWYGESRGYFSDPWNVFDFVLVCVSLPTIPEAIGSGGSGGGSTTTAFRGLRALRVTRLLRRHRSLQALVEMVALSLTPAGFLCCIMVLFLFIYTILGIQLFGNTFTRHEQPTFASLWQSALSVFIITTGESWSVFMAEAMSRTTPAAMLYHISLYSLGNNIFVNLFIATVVDSFAELRKKRLRSGLESESESEEEEDDESGDAWSRRSSDAVDKMGQRFLDELAEGGSAGACDPDAAQGAQQSTPTALASRRVSTVAGNAPNGFADYRCGNFTVKSGGWAHRPGRPRWTMGCGEHVLFRLHGNSMFVFGPENALRLQAAKIVYHPCFDNAVWAIVALNSALMSLDGPWRDGYTNLSSALDVLELCFVGLFVAEAALKILVLRFLPSSAFRCGKRGEGARPASLPLAERPYLSSRWNRLDFFVCLTAVIGLFVPFFRVFRAFRTLRIVLRYQNVKVVLVAIISALPSLVGILLLSLFIFVIFGILGVQLFKGSYYYCTDPTKACISNCTGVFSQPVCSATNSSCATDQEHCSAALQYHTLGQSPDLPQDMWGGTAPLQMQRQWRNRFANFDNLGEALMTLLQITLGDGWAEIMWAGIASQGTDVSVEAGRHEHPYVSAYFIAFVILGNFYLLNLFTGLLIDRFSGQRARLERQDWQPVASIFTTRRQQEWLAACKMLRCIKLVRLPTPPRQKWRRPLYYLVEHKWFERAIMAIIILNVVLMGLNHYGQPATMDRIHSGANYAFVGIYTLEAAVKIVAYDEFYFRDPWHRFDFALWVLSVIGIFLSNSSITIFRVLRIARVLRLIRGAQGIMKLFETLYNSLPSFGNVGLLLLATFFTFAVLGVNIVGRVARGRFIDKWFNFETVGNALFLLYVIASGENWNGFLYESHHRARGCELEDACGSGRAEATVFFVAFMICGSMVMMNLFITVVLENFGEQAQSAHWDSLFLGLDDFRMLWVAADTDAAGMLHANEVVELLRSPELSYPVGLRSKIPGPARELELLKKLRQLSLPYGGAPLTPAFLPVNDERMVCYWDCLWAIARKHADLPELVVQRVGKFTGGVKAIPGVFTVYHYHAVQCIIAYWRQSRQRLAARGRTVSAESAPRGASRRGSRFSQAALQQAAGGSPHSSRSLGPGPAERGAAQQSSVTGDEYTLLDEYVVPAAGTLDLGSTAPTSCMFASSDSADHSAEAAAGGDRMAPARGSFAVPPSASSVPASEASRGVPPPLECGAPAAGWALVRVVPQGSGRPSESSGSSDTPYQPRVCLGDMVIDGDTGPVSHSPSTASPSAAQARQQPAAVPPSNLSLASSRGAPESIESHSASSSDAPD